MDKCVFPKSQMNSNCNECPIATCSGKKVAPAPKPLAQYLADYLETETRRCADDGEYWSQAQLQEWLEQALDAYESTENVVIQIIKKKTR